MGYGMDKDKKDDYERLQTQIINMYAHLLFTCFFPFNFQAADFILFTIPYDSVTNIIRHFVAILG